MERTAGKGVKIIAVLTALIMTGFMVLASSTVYGAEETTGNQKEETVYVITNPDGSQKEVIVSDHLYNKTESKTLEDTSTLENIQNVKGDEEFTQSDDGSLTWKAAGNDIYYQGNTQAAAPITVHMTYYLDGKEITGEQLDGKSGEVKIVIDYENRQTVTVNGRSVKVPFVAMTGFLAEDEAFHHVSVSSGKVVDDGEKQIIVGMAVPGLCESLGVSADQLGFSDQVVITGTAEKFSVDSMMTIVTNSFLEDIDTDKLSELDLDGQIQELDNAAKQLVQGSTTLYNGIHLLHDKSQQLSGGVTQLNTGAQNLLAGTRQTNEGSQQLATGASQLSTALDRNLGALKTGADSLKSGSTQIYNGLLAVQTAIDGNGTQQNPGLKNAAASVASGLSSAKTTLDTGAAADESALTLLEKLKTTYNINENDQDYKELKTCLATSKASQSGVSAQLTENTGTLKVGADAVANGLNTLSGSLMGDGTQANPGLVNGSKSVKDGANTLANGLAGATADSDSLTSAASELAAGASSLKNGQQQVSDGAAQLAEGMETLSSSTGTLINGVNSLDLGAKELQSGMEQFYQQGIAKLVDLYNSDLKGITQNIDAVLQAGKQYDTFTQLPNGMSGSVKFIYKTELTSGE